MRCAGDLSAQPPPTQLGASEAMAGDDCRVEDLRANILELESRLGILRGELAAAEASRDQQGTTTLGVRAEADPSRLQDGGEASFNLQRSSASRQKWPLSDEEYKRYGRQLIIPEIGLQGQLRLKSCSVLIVGVGGLGCPAAAYLAGAGVGRLGLVDDDRVEASNLQRQILHSTDTINWSKVDSAVKHIQSLNPLVNCTPHRTRLTPRLALDIFSRYDVVLDCTDTPASRYLISDACVLLQLPLISASALRTDGQLTLLNCPPHPAGSSQGGPCYRCIFPRPPAPESVTSCGEGGILGPVVGVMGVLQALEAIRRGAWHFEKESLEPSMLLFSSYSSPPFRSVRLRRTRKAGCKACSREAVISREALTSGSMDYEQFCGTVAPEQSLGRDERVTAREYYNARHQQGTAGSVLVDVREKVEFDLCSIEGSVNIPYSTIVQAEVTGNVVEPEPAADERTWWRQLRQHSDKSIFVVCRLGNDSQVAVRKMKENGLDDGGARWIGDVIGGLKAWREDADGDFPEY